jgi:hypothetical protein
LICSFRYDLASFHNDGAEWTASSRADILERELNGAGHESFVSIHVHVHVNDSVTVMRHA